MYDYNESMFYLPFTTYSVLPTPGKLPPPPETTFQTYRSSINFKKPPDSLKALRLSICPLFSTRNPSTYQYIKECPQRKRDIEGNAVLLLPSARALFLKVYFWP
jgi:hypothetical protein